MQTGPIRRASFRGAGLRAVHQRSSRSDTLALCPRAVFMPLIHMTLFFFLPRPLFCFSSHFLFYFVALFQRKFVLRDWRGETRSVDTASGKSKNPVTAAVSFSRNEQTCRNESVWCRPCASAVGGNRIKDDLQICMWLWNCGRARIDLFLSKIWFFFLFSFFTVYTTDFLCATRDSDSRVIIQDYYSCQGTNPIQL